MRLTERASCINCLALGASAVDVGPERGTQRDPYRATLVLCERCEKALLDGRLDDFHAEYVDARTIYRHGGEQ